MSGFGFSFGFSKQRGLLGGVVLPPVASALTPGANWDGTASSGFASTPTDPARTTAKPVARLITTPHQTVITTKEVGVLAIANNGGTTIGGIDRVRFHLEGNTVDVTSPSAKTMTRVDNSTYEQVGYWVDIERETTNGVALLYAEVIPADPTMQSRVLGPYRYILRDTLYDRDVTVDPTQPQAGDNFQRLDSALGTLRAEAVQTARVTLVGATNDISDFVRNFDFDCEGSIEIVANERCVLSKAQADRGSFAPRSGPIRWGENVVFDWRYITAYASRTGIAQPIFEGCEHINSGGLEDSYYKGPNNNGFLFQNEGDNGVWIADCLFSDLYDPIQRSVELARGNVLTDIGRDVYTSARAVVGNISRRHDNRFYRTELDALTVTGPAGSTIAISGANDTDSRVVTAKENGATVGTFTVRNSGGSIGGAQYDVQDVADWIDTLAGWSATLLDDTRRASGLSIAGNSGGGFGDTDASSGLTLVTVFDLHGDWYQRTSTADTENVMIYGNVDEDGYSQIVFLTGTGEKNDYAIVNNSWSQIVDSVQVSQLDSTVSHLVFAHNNMPDQTLWLRNSFAGDAYTLIANNVLKDTTTEAGATLGGATIANNHYLAGGSAFAGDSGAVISGTISSLFVDAKNGDFTPAGELLTNLKAPVVRYDTAGAVRANPSTVGAGLLPDAVNATVALPSYSAAPSTNTFTDSPTAGPRVFSDATSFKVFGTDTGTTETANGTAAIAASPASNSVRGNVLMFTAPTANDHAFVAEQYKFLAFGADRNAANVADTTMGDILFQAEVVPVSGECLLYAIYADASQATALVEFGIADAGDGTFRFVADDTVASEAHDYGDMVKVRMSRETSGDLVLQANKGSGWATQVSATGVSTAAASSQRFGCFGSVAGAQVGFSAVSISDTSFDEMDRDFYIMGSGCRDIDQTRANLALFAPDGLFASATQARVRYAAGVSPVGGTATSFVALTQKQQNILALPITGLTANTQYSYQFEVANSGGTVIWTSEPYNFKTLAAQGTAQRGVWNYTSCYTQTAMCHPYRDEQYTLSQIDGDYLGTFHLGDRMYEGNPTLLLTDYMNGSPPETQDEYERCHRDYFCDYDIHELMKAGPVIFQPDDHEFINEGDYTARGSSTLANSFSGDQSGGQYSAGTTLGDLWTAGLDVSEAWDTRHWFDVPANDGGEAARYRFKAHGRTAIIQLDTRLTRNRSANRMISLQQMAWFKAQVDFVRDNASDFDFLKVVMQAGGSDFTNKGSDCWELVAPAQYEEYLDYLLTEVPSSIAISEMIGDDHLVYLLHRDAATTAFPALPSNYVGSLYASGGMVRYRFGDVSQYTSLGLDASEWSFNPTALGSDPIVKSSGVLVDMAADGTTIDMAVQSNGNASTFNAYTKPVQPTNTRQATMTVPARVVGANNTAGTVTEAVLLTRADLPNEMCDPSGSNAALADGRDIRAETTGGAPLEIEIVRFEYDSATNAADADVEIWVRHTLNKSTTTDFVLTYADSTGLSTAPSSANVFDDATAVYHGRATDSSGNGRDLATTNVSDIAGPFGRALSLNGTTSEMKANYQPRTGSNPRTGIAYLRIDSTQPAADGTIWAYGRENGSGAVNGERYTFRIDAGGGGQQPRIEVAGGAKNFNVLVANNAWRTLALTFPNGGSTVGDAGLRNNGVGPGAASTSGQPVSTADTGRGLEIGYETRSGGTKANYLAADYAELRFYNADIGEDRRVTIDNMLRQAGTFLTTGTPGPA